MLSAALAYTVFGVLAGLVWLGEALEPAFLAGGAAGYSCDCTAPFEQDGYGGCRCPQGHEPDGAGGGTGLGSHWQ